MIWHIAPGSIAIECAQVFSRADAAASAVYCDMPRMRRSPFCGPVSVSVSVSLSLTPLKVAQVGRLVAPQIYPPLCCLPTSISFTSPGPHRPGGLMLLLLLVACCMTQVQVGRMTFSALTHKIKSNGGVYKNSSNTSQTRTAKGEKL